MLKIERATRKCPKPRRRVAKTPDAPVRSIPRSTPTTPSTARMTPLIAAAVLLYPMGVAR
jgi:hypothetical protein